MSDETAPYRQKYSQMFLLCLVLLIFLWAIVNWSATLVLISKLYVAMPVADYWRVVQDLTRIRAFDFTLLWRQHNEHRILFEEIVFAADMLLFHGRTIMPLAVSFVCYFATWLVLVWLIFQEKTMPTSTKWLLAGLTGVLIGWKGSALVLADAFLLQWTLTGLAVMLSFVLLTRVKGGRSNALLAGVIACATIATYSSGNGLLLWPVLLVFGYLAGLRRKQLLILALAGLLADGLYFAGYTFMHDADYRKLILHPVHTFGFVASYVSMPFGAMKTPRLAVLIGAVNLALFSTLFYAAARRRLLTSPLGLVLFSWFVFTLVTALLTAGARMDLHDPSFAGAKPVRYVTPILVNWAVLIVLLFWIRPHGLSSQRFTPLFGVLIAALLLFSFRRLGGWVHAGEQSFVNAQTAELSIEDGLREHDLMQSALFPDYRFIEQYLPQLQSLHLATFYEDRARWLGKPLREFFRVRSSPAVGEVVKLTAKQSGYEALGWAKDPGLRGFETVVLANHDGQIIGFGRRNALALPFGIAPLSHTTKETWIAYVSSQRAGDPFSVYVLSEGDGILEKIPGEYRFPTK